RNVNNGDYGTVAGGSNNISSGLYAAVGGGTHNTNNGLAATIPGGFLNSAAADYSFAAGRRAKANHRGSFVWADSTDADFASTTNDQFLVRAIGGVQFVGAAGSALLSVNQAGDIILGNNTAMVIQTNGFVGIGITNPTNT